MKASRTYILGKGREMGGDDGYRDTSGFIYGKAVGGVCVSPMFGPKKRVSQSVPNPSTGGNPGPDTDRPLGSLGSE